MQPVRASGRLPWVIPGCSCRQQRGSCSPLQAWKTTTFVSLPERQEWVLVRMAGPARALLSLVRWRVAGWVEATAGVWGSARDARCLNESLRLNKRSRGFRVPILQVEPVTTSARQTTLRSWFSVERRNAQLPMGRKNGVRVDATSRAEIGPRGRGWGDAAWRGR